MPNELLAELLSTTLVRKVAILDSNLLVLWITAEAGLELTSLKRVRAFAKEDVFLLRGLLSRFQSTVTTAYALAEASNLGNALSGWKRQEWFEALARFATHTAEAHVATTVVGQSESVVPFGVTDAALTVLADSFVLITSEYRLSGHLESAGKQVVNFNHLRPLWMTQSRR